MKDVTHRSHHIADDLFRHEGARIVAVLTSHFGTHRLQLAEDAVQEALLKALQTWPYRGMPENPAAWLTQTARNVALDALRRELNWQEKEPFIMMEQDRWAGGSAGAADGEGALGDDTLRMLFVCFHPQLSTEAQTALALRVVCGLSPAEIGAAFLTSEATIAKRLVRARKRVRELALPFALPEGPELSERLDGVLQALYLLFNEGYKASSGDRLVREDLCREAIRLTHLLCEHAATNTPRTCALLALMQLTAARLPARMDNDGGLLRLHEQNRAIWDRQLIAQGMCHLAKASTGAAMSQYHLEAGIAAIHSMADNEAETDWVRILAIYDQLVGMTASPVVAMNRAVAMSRVHGAKAGLESLDAIADSTILARHHLFHAIRGSLHAELGQRSEALGHFRQAHDLATLPAEREFLVRKLAELEPGSE